MECSGCNGVNKNAADRGVGGEGLAGRRDACPDKKASPDRGSDLNEPDAEAREDLPLRDAPDPSDEREEEEPTEEIILHDGVPDRLRLADED